MSVNINVGVVINNYHHLRGGTPRKVWGIHHDSDVGHACNDCNGVTIAYIMTENLSLTVLL